MGFVYLITCLSTGKYYVGQTINRLAIRWSGHKLKAKRGNGHLQCAIRKYGADNFVIETLTSADAVALNHLERLWVLALDATNPDVGMNLTYGGDGAGTKTAAECAAIAKRMHGNKHGLGKTHTPEECIRIGLRGKNRKLPDSLRESFDRTGKTPWNKGKKASPEQVAALKNNYWEKRKNAAQIKDLLRKQAGNRKGKKK
jgi:group I intron endonuclease